MSEHAVHQAWTDCPGCQGLRAEVERLRAKNRDQADQVVQLQKRIVKAQRELRGGV